MEVQIILNYAMFKYSTYLEGNQYLHKKLFKLILKILNDEDNFTKLRSAFHRETPIVVIENYFPNVLVNIKKIVFYLTFRLAL